MAQLWDLTDSGSSPRVLAGHTGAIWSVALTEMVGGLERDPMKIRLRDCGN